MSPLSRRLPLRVCFATLPWLLAACASAPPAEQAEAITTQAPVLEPAILFSGRMALSVAGQPSGPAKSFSALFELSGTEAIGQLKLLTPLGTQLAEARWSPTQGATLNTGQGDVRYQSLDDLAEQALGEAIPLQAVGHWLHGRAWPSVSFVATPTGFEQLGWQINLSRLSSDGLLVAQRSASPTHPGVTLRLKLDSPEQTP